MRERYLLLLAVISIVVAPVTMCGAATPCYIGLYADPLHCDLATFTDSPFEIVDMWVWIQPSDVGLQAVEFSITSIANAWPVMECWNPATEYLTIGDSWSGVSIAFPECQTDWVWTHRLVMLVAYPTTVGFWQIAGRWDAEPYYKQYASCEPEHPIYPLTVLNPLALNQCPFICGCYPRLASVDVLGASALRITFNSCVSTSNEPYTDRFHIFAEGSAVEAMDVIGAERISDSAFDLSLGGAMVGDATYVFVAKDIFSCGDSCPWIESSSLRFVCSIPIATLLRSHRVSFVDGAIEIAWTLSAIDPGATFRVSRSVDGGAFEDLDGAPIEEAALSYRYVDESIEPDRDYLYRVAYAEAGGERILFTSDVVTTPAAEFALYQNVPNPFNPSTTISFSLPEACTATLEIYNVAGRLIARLIDGESLSEGAHHVDWDGRDAGGNAAAAGIYFCRLAAGKEALTRKMILLR